MGDTSQTALQEKIRELIDKGSECADLDRILFEDILHKAKAEFDAAEPKTWDELTDEELAEMEEDDAEINRQLKRKARLNKIRLYFCLGMKLKSNDPSSKLFRVAEELLDILDRYETDPLSISQTELRKYKTGLLKYNTLLEEKIKKHNTKERSAKPKAAEAPEDIPGEYRTAPMSQTELANLYGGDMTQKKIRAMIDSGILRVICQTRQTFIFDKRQLPPHVKEKLVNLEQS